ncbi:MAG TPA: histidine kinase [Terriglobales bacterium]|nr:histidine kinase [Terriglobales bacterium]
MSDSAKRFPSFWQLQIAGGVCFYLLVLVASVADLKRPGWFAGQTIGVAFIFLSTLAMHPICRALYRRSPSWLAFELKAFVASQVVGTAGALATELTVLRSFREIQWGDLATNSMQFGVVLFLWCTLYFSIKQWLQASEERERLLRAESEAREARLSALRYQLNPHFLFNSLNAVSTLVLDGNAPAATRMLAQIADLLRTTLENEAVPEVPLSQEIAFARQYLAIEQTRLGDRLRVEMVIAPETLDALVPGMILQPLIENAVRHGVAPRVDGGTVAIRSDVHSGQLRIVIGNSRPPGKILERADGIGLSNTKARLRTLYGRDHSFLLTCPDGGGCEVAIQLPLRLSPAQEPVACVR